MILSAFKPFAKMDVNPTMELVADLSLRLGCKYKILPVSYEKAYSAFCEFLESLDSAQGPVVHFGLAQKRKKISIELCAHNIQNATISDQDGVILDGSKIAQEGPEILYTRFSKQKLQDLESDFVEFSEDCGQYVCNRLYYDSLNAAGSTKVLFIHIPWPADWPGFDSSMTYTQILSNTQKILEKLALI